MRFWRVRDRRFGAGSSEPGRISDSGCRFLDQARVDCLSSRRGGRGGKVPRVYSVFLIQRDRRRDMGRDRAFGKEDTWSDWRAPLTSHCYSLSCSSSSVPSGSPKWVARLAAGCANSGARFRSIRSHLSRLSARTHSQRAVASLPAGALRRPERCALRRPERCLAPGGGRNGAVPLVARGTEDEQRTPHRCGARAVCTARIRRRGADGYRAAGGYLN